MDWAKGDNQAGVKGRRLPVLILGKGARGQQQDRDGSQRAPQQVLLTLPQSPDLRTISSEG